MLRPRVAHTLLIAAALLASASPLLASASPAATQDDGAAQDETPRAATLALPSRVSFQREAWRHRAEAVTPVSASLREEPRELWLARLAAEGRRPVRPAWRPEVEGDETTRDDRFARLSFDVGGMPTLLPLHVAEPERWTRVMESLATSSTCACTGWGGSPGRVPDGDILLGQVLRAAKSASNVVLSWGVSCSTAATDYTVHEGAIGSWYSHQAVACTSGSGTTATVTPGAGPRYFLVVPVNDDSEGSYGANSVGQDRPSSTVSCRSVWAAQRCP